MDWIKILEISLACSNERLTNYKKNLQESLQVFFVEISSC